MVLKTGPDWLVRSSTGHGSGLVRSIGPELCWIGIRPVEPVVRQANRTNRPIPFKPDGSIIIIIFKKITMICRFCTEVKKLPPPTRHDTDASSHRRNLRPLHRCNHPSLLPPTAKPPPGSTNPQWMKDLQIVFGFWRAFVIFR